MSDSDSRFYYGSREVFRSGDEVPTRKGFVYFARTLDAAIWAAELADGEDESRVYEVAVSGPIENMEHHPDHVPAPHPTMSWRTANPMTVLGEVTDWKHYHGTRADLQIGDLIKPGYRANFGPTLRSANFVYFARTLDAAIWGAELAAGEQPPRIYLVKPTGEFEDDPNLTNMRFRGNPTKSFRSRAPLRVTGELKEWTGHPVDTVRAMKASLDKLDQNGVEPND